MSVPSNPNLFFLPKQGDKDPKKGAGVLNDLFCDKEWLIPRSHLCSRSKFTLFWERVDKWQIQYVILIPTLYFHQKNIVHRWQAPKSIRTRVGFHAVIITALPMVLWLVPGQTLSHVQEEIQEGRREVSDWGTSPQERWKDTSCWVWAYCLLKCCGCNRECWSFNKNSVSLCQAWL